MSIAIVENKQSIRFSFFRELFEANAWVVFVLLCLIYALVQYVQQELVLTDELYYNTLGEQLTTERIAILLDSQHKYQWLGYLFIPLVLIFQAFLISICLSIGAVLIDLEIGFKQFFGMVIKAITVLAIGKIILTIVLVFSEINKLEDIISADVFSLLGWIGQEALPQWLWYPFAMMNIFEALFIATLIVGVRTLVKKEFKNSFGFVLSSYGAGLLLWIVFIVFIQLNFST